MIVVGCAEVAIVAVAAIEDDGNDNGDDVDNGAIGDVANKLMLLLPLVNDDRGFCENQLPVVIVSSDGLPSVA
jgi:hypothetical protein